MSNLPFCDLLKAHFGIDNRRRRRVHIGNRLNGDKPVTATVI